ncbi:MAG: cell envelope integrity EipB family protein [Bdellovibrionales bacterium]
MRSLLSFSGLTVLSLALLCAMGTPDAEAALPSSVPAPAKTEAPPAPAPSQTEPVSIAPHRAIYKMSLDSAKNGSNVSDISGRMLFEWRDVCDGWALQQRMQLHFSYVDEDDQEIVSNELTWESKDGKRYSFNVRRSTNGQETDNYHGKAVQNADGTLTVSYDSPEGKKVKFPTGTIFPTAHTKLILQAAAKGEKFFSRRVFDGFDEDGASDISAFIIPQRPLAKETLLKTKGKKSPILLDKAWPVHLAFFSDATETGEPDYEMDMNLLANGVSHDMKIDYGDFSVTGKLEDIQALKPQVCP